MVRPRQVETEVAIVYEPAENGSFTARIPIVPGTISTGSDRAEARRKVLDAFATMLALEPGRVPPGAAIERLPITLAVGREAARDPGRMI